MGHGDALDRHDPVTVIRMPIREPTHMPSICLPGLWGACSGSPYLHSRTLLAAPATLRGRAESGRKLVVRFLSRGTVFRQKIRKTGVLERLYRLRGSPLIY